MEIEKMPNTTKKWERRLALLALLILLAAWIAGNFRARQDLMPALRQLHPQAGHFEPVANGLFKAWTDGSGTEPVGYLAVATSQGYGGAMKVIVSISAGGAVENLLVAAHKETPSFFRRVEHGNFIDSLKGKLYQDPFVLKGDIDGVSGATYTCRALAEATRKGSRLAAQELLNFTVPPEPRPAVRFGFPEAVLIGLFILGYAGTRKGVKMKRTLRWAALLSGLFFIGFIYNNPLNLVFINKMLLGYWPRWQLNLYWYLLLAAVLFMLIFEKRNIYCDRICPFGAVQECMGVIGGSKLKIPPKPDRLLRWLQRLAAVSAVGIALYLKNPGRTSYEVFGAFFRLLGSDFQFVLLGIVLVLALFIKRPWCYYLCPLRAVTDYIMLLNNWLREKTGRKRNPRPSASGTDPEA